MGDCVSQCSPEAPKLWLRVAGVISKAQVQKRHFQSSQPGPKSILLLPGTLVGETSPGFLSIFSDDKKQRQIGLLPSSQVYGTVSDSAT